VLLQVPQTGTVSSIRLRRAFAPARAAPHARSSFEYQGGPTCSAVRFVLLSQNGMHPFAVASGACRASRAGGRLAQPGGAATRGVTCVCRPATAVVFSRCIGDGRLPASRAARRFRVLDQWRWHASDRHPTDQIRAAQIAAHPSRTPRSRDRNRGISPFFSQAYRQVRDRAFLVGTLLGTFVMCLIVFTMEGRCGLFASACEKTSDLSVLLSRCGRRPRLVAHSNLANRRERGWDL
jgi:hypothetical protein